MSTIEKTVKEKTVVVEESTSLWQDAWIRLKKNRLALISLYVLITISVMSIVVPFLSPYSYEEINFSAMSASPPSAKHWFGTDVLGRDMFTRTMWGGRVSLGVGLIATIVSLIIGVLWGTIAGYKGGRVDAIMMRIVDIMFALPFVIFIILLMVIFGSNLILLFMSIGGIQWLTMARIVRGQVLSIRKQEFVEAAISMGIPNRMIILKHLVPNVLGVIIVYTTLTIPQVMLLEAFLSFLGLGIQAPMSSWGLLINYGVETLEEYPWLTIFPGMVFAITLFCFNFLGDGLRDALDPKASKD